MAMDVKKAYSIWANQYDSNDNKTRDLEAKALRLTLSDLEFESCLELGCGTGKNTAWFCTKAKHILAIDFSPEMLAVAKAKVKNKNVQFLQVDIRLDWDFANTKFDLISFSLVLEHIQNINEILEKANALLKDGGLLYIGELHPYKQYTGSKARFEDYEGIHIVNCFDHSISEFTQAAKANGFSIEDINEYFDADEMVKIPRILTLLLKKIN